MKKNLLSCLISLLITGLLLYAIPPARININKSPLMSDIDQAIAATGKATIDLYIMSLCPYGIEAQKALLPILLKKGSQIDLNLYFIAKELPGNTFQSMHGEPEVREDRRQLTIARNFPNKLVQYLTHRLVHPSDSNWSSSVIAAGLNPHDIERLINTAEELEAFKANIAMGKEKKISASPTTFINNIHFTADRKTRKICKCLGGPNDGGECDTEKDTLACPRTCLDGYDDGATCTTGSCRAKCIGGSNAGMLCTADSQCQSLECRPGHCVGYCTDCPLPVKLIQFKSTVLEDMVSLTWQTAEETNNKGFEVQHSNDGQFWKTVSFVESANNSDLQNDYSWTSGKLQPGIHYYRLKQLDLNGKYEIHNTITVRIAPATELTAQVTPNPTTGVAKIFINSKKEARANVYILTTTGQKVLQRAYQVKKGDNIFLLDVRHVPAGQLTVIIESNGVVQTRTNLLLSK